MTGRINLKKFFSSIKENFPQNWCKYLIINCVFLLPAVLITLVPQIVNFLNSLPNTIGNILGFIIFPFWLMVIIYYVLGLTYLHCALSFCFLLFFIYKIIKEKIRNRKLIFTFFSLTIVCIILNIYWLTYAERYMGV